MFELRSSEFERFSQSSASFLSKAGAVLIFFASFFVSRQKNEEVGFWLNIYFWDSPVDNWKYQNAAPRRGNIHQPNGNALEYISDVATDLVRWAEK